MSDKDISSNLFTGVLLKLNEVYGHDGNRLDGDEMERPFHTYVAFQRRPVERFAHNYERDKFLHHRDKYVILNANSRYYIVAELKERENVTMYKKPLMLMFGQDSPKATIVLEKLLHKFYHNVTIEDISTVREIDLSQSGNSGNTQRVSNEI